MSIEKKPHVHAELIKAWADGAQIQFYLSLAEEWLDVQQPFWDGTLKYRIKPEPKPDIKKNFFFDHGKFYNGASSILGTNIIVTFHGETGKIKHVEIV